MNVSELIEKLKTYPQDMMIFVNYDCGASYDPPDLEIETIDYNEYSDVAGYHAEDTEGSKKVEVLTIV